jgi:tetratricopeptide (TPR) repeat protein
MMETPKYTPKFRAFYIALSRGKDVVRSDGGYGGWKTVEGPQIQAAFQKIMGLKDLVMLEQEWMEYVKGRLKAESVVGLEEAAFAAFNTDQTIRAERFFKAAIEKGSTNPSVYRRYGDLKARKSVSSAEAIELYRKGLEFDPLSADLYTRLGREIRAAKGDENDKEGKRLLELAREIDPDNADITLLIEDAMEKLAGDAGDAPK